ncbi:DUF5786 family protein [Halopenitus salinus]|jgi:hypothetical protein|uniref:DUF5786 family protein n=1 Tax=Halopenitus salinus TaxID=1198295 RepID=A0ABD5UTY8_9EURY
MGFGSYDESEQETQSQDDEDDSEAVNVHENEHDGSVSFESEASTDDLVGRLSEMRDAEDDAEGDADTA